VDHVDVLWVKVLLLSIPLQLALVVVSLTSAQLESPGARRLSVLSGGAVTLLIAVHVTISVSVAFAGGADGI